MDILIASCVEAFRLLFSGDPDTWEIVAISFRVSTLAILCAVPPALLIAFALAYGNFVGRRLLISVFNTFLSVPAVTRIGRFGCQPQRSTFWLWPVRL